MSELPPIEYRVLENLRNAKEGGYDMSGYSDEILAADLQSYASDLENESIEDIVVAVKQVRSIA